MIIYLYVKLIKLFIFYPRSQRRHLLSTAYFQGDATGNLSKQHEKANNKEENKTKSPIPVHVGNNFNFNSPRVIQLFGKSQKRYKTSFR